MNKKINRRLDEQEYDSDRSLQNNQGSDEEQKQNNES